MRTDEQIREKLINKGASELTDAELLSIVIRDGGKNLSAVEAAESLLESHNNSLTHLGAAEVSRLRMSAGIGLGKAAIVAAAMELGKRRKAEESATIERINSKNDVIAYLKPVISELKHEEFWALFLNSSNRILDKVKISQGGTSSTVVDNKLIIKRALEKLACSIIIAHNHPSGNPSPTEADITVTEKLRQAAGLFDIELLDHIIITSGDCYSFKAEGLL